MQHQVGAKMTVYNDNQIGENLCLGHYVLIRHSNIIGDNVRIGSYSEVAYQCKIENGVHIHSGCFICEHSILRKRCWLGPHVMLINDKYPQTDNKYKRAPEIGERAVIGANSLIMPGVKIGKYAVIGAGSVVCNNVPARQVWCGHPAKYLKQRKDIDAYSAL